MKRVGVRELRQNLSVHLRQVKAGAALEVTERGQPVAVLAPLPVGAGARERLIAAGKLRPARISITELEPLPETQPSTAASKALAELRSERL